MNALKSVARTQRVKELLSLRRLISLSALFVLMCSPDEPGGGPLPQNVLLGVSHDVFKHSSTDIYSKYKSTI